VKTAILGTCGSNNWETDRWVGYMLRGVWQALNCLFIHATFCVIANLPQGRLQGKQKMKAGVRKDDYFVQLWFE